MPRKHRIHYPGALYHVILRGNAGYPLFLDDRGREHFYDLVGQGVERFGHRLHAFCLMTNHVHLLITPERADAVPRLIIALGRRYVQYINTSYRRSGTLWDSRYKSSLIQAETYLLACQRYIELNPVRAAMVEAANAAVHHNPFWKKQFERLEYRLGRSKTVVAIAGGTFHSLALCSDGTVAAWGDNSRGQLGDNTTTQRKVPVAVNTTPLGCARASGAVSVTRTVPSHQRSRRSTTSPSRLRRDRSPRSSGPRGRARRP